MKNNHCIPEMTIFTVKYMSIWIVEQKAQQRDIASAMHVFLGSLTDRAIHWTPQLLYSYTLGHKKVPLYFYDNFGKCGPISIILSLLDS